METRRVFRGRVAAACLVLGGLAATVGVSVTSGALNNHATKGVVVSTLKTTKYGTILVSGKTVYTLKPSGVGCNTTCLKFWPKVLLPKGVTKATAGPGVSAAKLGTVRRADGSLQVTYAGKTLYWLFLDTAPGQVKGNVTDAWGKWSVVVTVKPASGGGTTTTTRPPATTTTTIASTTTTRPPATTTTTRPPATTTTTSSGGGGIGF